jgi:hypothetical protein
MKTCHTCKQDIKTYEKKILIDIGHPTPINLGFTANVCQKCINQMNRGEMLKAGRVKLVLAR